MKKFLTLFSMFFAVPLGLLAQNAEESKSISQRINEAVQPATDAVSSIVFFPLPGTTGQNAFPIVIIFLLLAASFFTVYFRFINIRGFKLAINTVRGNYTKKGEEGEVSHFQALTAALSGTVGLGNIAGVAIAISLGGPGATFWMIIAGLLGMSSKFVECTLGVKYRDIGPDGTVYGGPMYYLRKGLGEMKLESLGKGLAIFFAIMCVGGSFGGGNMFQANQAAAQFIQMIGTTNPNASLFFGFAVAAIVAVVIIGGIKRIGSVTERIVPFMVGIYLLAAFVVIGANISNVPSAFGQIISGAFTPMGIAGGFIGVLIQGFRRAAFSNEAGVGSAAIAHAAVKTKQPASEGIVALLEPFIDTVVVCTITALVIIIANGDGSIMVYGQKAGGVTETSAAFATVLPWFPYILTVAVVLFAFSTMISWSYYGLQSWMYLFGRSKKAEYSYKVLFCIMVVIGSSASLSAVTDFSDAMIFAMSVPNLIGLIIMRKKVKEELSKYFEYVKNFVK